MSSQAQALEHLQDYVRSIEEKCYDTDSHGDEQAYEARLNKTMAYLKDQIHREQNTLQTVSNPLLEPPGLLITNDTKDAGTVYRNPSN